MTYLAALVRKGIEEANQAHLGHPKLLQVLDDKFKDHMIFLRQELGGPDEDPRINKLTTL